jgi:hypothetical protein
LTIYKTNPVSYLFEPSAAQAGLTWQEIIAQYDNTPGTTWNAV